MRKRLREGTEEESEEPSCMIGVPGRFLCDIQVEARSQRSTDATQTPQDNLCVCLYIPYIILLTYFFMRFGVRTHLTMKSNSEPASIRTPNKVEKAPSSTGANMCSSASTARL